MATIEKQTLTAADAKKLASLTSQLYTIAKAGKDEAKQKNVVRFADKWLRWKRGVRGTGPHSHGLDEKQRAMVYTLLRSEFKLPAPKASAPTKAAPAKGKGKAPSTATLAKQQAARAAQS